MVWIWIIYGFYIWRWLIYLSILRGPSKTRPYFGSQFPISRRYTIGTDPLMLRASSASTLKTPQSKDLIRRISQSLTLYYTRPSSKDLLSQRPKTLTRTNSSLRDHITCDINNFIFTATPRTDLPDVTNDLSLTNCGIITP